LNNAFDAFFCGGILGGGLEEKAKRDYENVYYSKCC